MVTKLKFSSRGSSDNLVKKKNQDDGMGEEV